MESEKSAAYEKGERICKGRNSGEIEGRRDKLAIRRHIRLDEQRITTCHLSARCFFRKLVVRRESAGSRHANHSIENAHARCLFDRIEPCLFYRINFILSLFSCLFHPVHFEVYILLKR